MLLQHGPDLAEELGSDDPVHRGVPGYRPRDRTQLRGRPRREVAWQRRMRPRTSWFSICKLYIEFVIGVFQSWLFWISGLYN